MKHLPPMLLMGLLSILPLACTSPTSRAPQGGLIAPDSTVESYYLPFWDENPEENPAVHFPPGRNGYTLIDNATGRTIRLNIYYQKTFGGAFPSVKVQVINSRFIVFPETIRGSEVPGELFCDMKAVTRIHDLKRRRMLPTGAPYQYNHNVPLKYDVDRLLWQTKEE